MQILTQKEQSLSTKMNNDNDLKNCKAHIDTVKCITQAFVLTIDIGHLDC